MNLGARRTTLLRVLADSPFSEGIVLFNGSNNDETLTSDLRRVVGQTSIRTKPEATFVIRPVG